MADPKEHVYSRLKPKTKKALEEEAEREGRSLSSMIAYVCDQWVSRRKKK